jgi:hypothetical protein
MPALPRREDLYRSILRYAERLRQHYWSEALELPLSNSSSVSLSVCSTHTSCSSSSSTSTSTVSVSSSVTQQSFKSDSWITSFSDQDEVIGDGYLHSLRRLRDYFFTVVNTRVLFSNGPVPKVGQLHLVLEWYREHHEARFRRNLRVHPLTFDGILYRIESDPVFYSDSNNNQIPVSYQLAIALFRFGHFGNAASVESVAQWAGCSAGLVVSCTRRITIAIIRLQNQAIKMPTPLQKAEAKRWVESVSCPAWRGGYCMVDGTLVPLADKPGYFGESFFDRKSNYSINLTVNPILPPRYIVLTLSSRLSISLIFVSLTSPLATVGVHMIQRSSPIPPLHKILLNGFSTVNSSGLTRPMRFGTGV